MFGNLFKKFFGTQSNATTASETTTKTNVNEDFSGMKMSELREIAKSRELKGWTKLRKSELVEFLSN